MAVTKELIEAIEEMQRGNPEGFAKVYEETHNYVYAKAKYMMKSEQDALDLTQETYIQAYRGIASLKDANNIYAWLGGIVNRQGMKVINKKKELLAGETQEYIFDDIESNEATPEQMAEQNATVEIIREMIDELPELQRVAVMAFYYDNMKIDAIADMCECSSNTIKSRLNYAKKFLKTKVEEHERKNRYKLCSVSPAILFLVFKGLFSEETYKMPAQAAKSVYEASCSALGIEAVSLSASGAAAGVPGGSEVAGNAANGLGSGVTAGNVASVVGTTAKISLMAKIGMVAASLAIIGGIGVTVSLFANKSAPQNSEIAIEQTDREYGKEEQAEAGRHLYPARHFHSHAAADLRRGCADGRGRDA